MVGLGPESELFNRSPVDRVEPIKNAALTDRPDEASRHDGGTTGTGRGLPLHAEGWGRGAGLDGHHAAFTGHVGDIADHGAAAVDISAAERAERRLLASDTAQMRLG